MSSYELEGGDPHEETVRISGRVKWFDPAKGYGFIVPDDPDQTDLRDVLLHVTSLRQCGRETALEGSAVVCDVVRLNHFTLALSSGPDAARGRRGARCSISPWLKSPRLNSLRPKRPPPSPSRLWPM